MTATKQLLGIEQAPPRHWVGDGFPVSSMFSYDSAPYLSPFLLLDYAAPAEFKPALVPRGVGEHPHRGFETVTIAYQGEIDHRDSAGHKGRIGPGDVQWMTAASGIVHEEMHGKEFTKTGGTLEMVQLWVNLPARFKKAPPGYQDVVGSRTPVVMLPGEAGSVRVIAGEFEKAKGPARTFTPIELWDLRLRAGKTAKLNVPAGQSTALLFLHGGGLVNGEKTVDEGGLAVLARDGETLSIEAGADSTVLLLSGAPIDEPVFGYGPFVMNTEKEIRQAIADYRSGLMGHLA
ncbi:MAG TPA: pirin family protein [Thermoanaerobaculia bacterium]|nr:pirin family protein [Thermoanaerobaculia bacterium]